MQVRNILYRRAIRPHAFRGGKTVGSAQVSEDGFEEVNVIGVMAQCYAETVGGSVERGEPSIVLAA